MIEAPEEFLPLGSVVRLKGSDKTMMIIGRALVLHRDAGEVAGAPAPSAAGAPGVEEGAAEPAAIEPAAATRPVPAGPAQPAREFYDYGLCLFPEGVMGDALIYSNHDCVSEVLLRGLANEEDEAAVAQILEAMAHMDIPRGAPQPADEW